MSTPCKKVKEFIFTELYLEMQCTKNNDGSRNLILRGNDLIKKIGRRVRNSDLLKIGNFLRRHTEVVTLELPYNNINDCGMSTLVDFLKERPVMRHLNLIGNDISARGIGYLAKLAQILPLFSLRLTGNKLGNEGGQQVGKLLCSKSGLRYLDVSDTHQTMSGLAYILAALMPSRGGTSTLEYIDIGRPLPLPYHQVCDAHTAEFIGQVIKDNKNLKEIHVQQYGFDFRDVEILLEGLFANNTLICLDLNNNNIGDDGVDYLCKYLRTSPALECLMIGSNNFGDYGALSLSFNLPFSKIRLLDITNNRITDEGMINIFYTIIKTEALKALFLFGNKITHKSLVVMQRLFHTGLLDPEHTDIKLFCQDHELNAAWNSHANRYTHRFYCVSDFGDSILKKLLMVSYPPAVIKYKYHADNSEVGFPMCEWELNVHPRYFDPI